MLRLQAKLDRSSFTLLTDLQMLYTFIGKRAFVIISIHLFDIICIHLSSSFVFMDRHNSHQKKFFFNDFFLVRTSISPTHFSTYVLEDSEPWWGGSEGAWGYGGPLISSLQVRSTSKGLNIDLF